MQHFVQTTIHDQALQSLSPTDDGQKREELLKLLARYLGLLINIEWQIKIIIIIVPSQWTLATNDPLVSVL